MILHDFLRGLRDALSPALRPLLWRVLGLSVVLSGLVFYGAWSAIGFVPSVGWAWADAVLQVAGGILVALALVFLFPVLITSLLSLFLDEAAARVEAVRYPDDPPGVEPPFRVALKAGLGFLVTVLLLNLAALPLQLVGLVVPLVNLLVFWSLNGYLVGREVFEQVAIRHASPPEVGRLRRLHRGLVFGAGLLGTALMAVPGVNLIAPLITVAAMVHLVRRVRRVAIMGQVRPVGASSPPGRDPRSE